MNANADDEQALEAPAGHSRAVLVVLLALVNAPAVLALVWLAANLLVDPAGAGLPARMLTGAVLALGITGSVLLIGVCRQRDHRLEEALATSAEQRERLRGVLENVAYAVLTVDGTCKILSCNLAGAELFGYRPDDLIGVALDTLLPTEIPRRTTDTKTDELRALTLSYHGGEFGSGTIGVRKNGSRFPASVTVSKTRRDGTPRYLVMISDLTEINQIRHAADAAQRAKNSLLQRVNHELRTPLGGILGTVDLLRETPLADRQARHLDVIQESAETLLGVFNQLVDHARLESGQVELARQAFSLRQTIEQVLAPLRHAARAKGVRLDLDISPELPDQVVGDSARLGQLLAALADNAVKFTPRGEVAVRVRLGNGGRTPTASPRKSPPASLFPLHFEVRDTGIGIEPEQVERLFEPFEQADASSSRSYGGLGLGLSVAARLAELMGGRIEVSSEPGRGSRFSFALDLEPAGPAALPAWRTVLVVLSGDDERRDLVDALTEWGIEATPARTGRQALTELLRAVVEGKPFGLVLIEEHLPDLSAREVLNRLRDRSDAPPAVLLGHSETDVPLPAGVRAVMPRRVSGQRLFQTVLEALASR